MAVPLGITACSSSEFWKTPEVQTEQTVDNSVNDATVQEEDTKDKQSEAQNTCLLYTSLHGYFVTARF